MSTKVYVGNLPYDATDNDLQALFSQYGPVKEVKVIMDRDSGRSKGFAFVEFEQAEGAQAALVKDGEEWNSRRLKVNIAKPRENNNRSGGGYRDKRF